MLHSSPLCCPRCSKHQLLPLPLSHRRLLMQITLLVPELIWPEPDDQATLDPLSCPGLSTLLGRSRLQQRPPQSLEATLSDLFGVGGSFAYAAYRAHGEEPPLAGEEDCWLCADPVHLRLHQERLILADGASLAVDRAEAEAIVADFNHQFADVGCFHLKAADRWYLQLPRATDLGRFDVLPLSVVAGRRVVRQLPEDHELRWLRRLLNEAQMLLHQHPVNEARDRDGRPTINSLWLWGGGALPAATDRVFSAVWSENPLARGLGRAAGAPVYSLPAQASDWLAQTPCDGRHLLVLEALQAPVQYEDGDAWRSALHDLERRWFAPLQKALARGTIGRLRLEAPTAYAALSWDAQRSDQWKFWRRPLALADSARALAASAR